MKRPKFDPKLSRTEPLPVFGRAVKELFDIARTLSANLYVDGLLKEIVRVTEKLTQAEAASLLLVDEEGRHLYFRTATGDKGGVVQGQLVPLSQGLAGWVVGQGASAIVNDVRRDPRFAKDVDHATGFTTRSVLAVPFKIRGRVIGVCEAINKKGGPFTEADQRVLEELAALASVQIDHARHAEAQNNFFENMIEILTAAIESADPAYAGHPARTAALSCAIGERLGLSGTELSDLYYGALLHDVGIIAVNHKALLEKATPRDQARTRERAHPLLGAELLKGVRLLKNVVPIVRHHHEAWDGSGHPDHLAGDQIPLGARIVGLVEQLEEIRFSGLAEPDVAALQKQMAVNGSGSKFAPAVVDAFLAVYPELKH